MGVDELLTVAVDFCGQPISVIGQACSEILIYEFTPRHLFCQRTTSITGTEETMLTSSRTAPTSPVHAKVRWGSARPPRQPSELDATYHIAHGTPIIFCSLPSGIVQHRPLRPRTIFALDVATARPPEVRANVGATNKSSVPLRIGNAPVADRSTPLPQAIGNGIALRDGKQPGTSEIPRQVGLSGAI